LDQAYDKLRKKAQIKGFRKGKAPRGILEKHYGAQTHMDTISHLIDHSYQRAIQEHHIPAVALPKIEDLKMEDGQPITYTAEVEVQPQVEAKDYLNIKLEKNKLEVSDAELEAELKAIQKAHAQRVPVAEDKVAEAGHIATIDYHGTVDGVPFEGGSAKFVQIELGAGRYLPDFEAGLLGMKKGEAREVNVDFPQDYGHEPLRGKKAVFRLELHELKEEALPALDDEFAKDIGNYESLEQIKTQLREHMLKAKESSERGELFKQIIDHLLEKNNFEIPEAMVDRELDYMLKTVREQLNQQEMSLEKLGLTEADWRAKSRGEAVRRIKGFLLFDSIAAQNQLEVTDADLEQKLSEIAQRYKQPVEAIKKYYEEHQLIRPLFNQVLEEKTLDFLISKAKIVEKKK
jgi:trigger factor